MPSTTWGKQRQTPTTHRVTELLAACLRHLRSHAHADPPHRPARAVGWQTLPRRHHLMSSVNEGRVRGVCVCVLEGGGVEKVDEKIANRPSHPVNASYPSAFFRPINIRGGEPHRRRGRDHRLVGRSSHPHPSLPPCTESQPPRALMMVGG